MQSQQYTVAGDYREHICVYAGGLRLVVSQRAGSAIGRNNRLFLVRSVLYLTIAGVHPKAQRDLYTAAFEDYQKCGSYCGSADCDEIGVVIGCPEVETRERRCAAFAHLFLYVCCNFETVSLCNLCESETRCTAPLCQSPVFVMCGLFSV